jgi:phosphatidylglycerol lysyltransferase
VPDLRTALKQFALAAIDITIACAALLALIPQATLADLPVFLAAYVVAITVALIVHAPGGLGVFEAVMIVALPQVDRATLVSALLVYRVAYYWLPLALAVLALAVNEWRVVRARRLVQVPESRPGTISDT